MGGHPAGERAASLVLAACEVLPTTTATDPAEWLRSRIEAARAAIAGDERAAPSRTGMGATVVLALVRGGVAWIAHAGDSRAYAWSSRGLERLTEDHNAAAEAVREGRLSQAEAMYDPGRHRLTRAIMALEARPEFAEPVAVGDGDVLLLVSDGITGTLEDRGDRTGRRESARARPRRGADLRRPPAWRPGQHRHRACGHPMLRRSSIGAALVAIALLAWGCSGGDSAPEATPTPTATTDATASSEATNAPNTSAPSDTPSVSPTTTPSVASTADPTSAPASSAAPPQVRLERALGTQRFQRPVELAVYPGGRYLLADQGGLVTVLTPGDPEEAAGETTLLDLRGRVLTNGAEEGFLSLALDPEFESNGYLYAYYSMANPRRTVLSRFEVAEDVADPASELIILEFEQPYANHNGGAIRFGPDGLLYLGLGDGGSSGRSAGKRPEPGRSSATSSASTCAARLRAAVQHAGRQPRSSMEGRGRRSGRTACVTRGDDRSTRDR